VGEVILQRTVGPDVSHVQSNDRTQDEQKKSRKEAITKGTIVQAVALTLKGMMLLALET
jgi:hypothetical protein